MASSSYLAEISRKSENAIYNNDNTIIVDHENEISNVAKEVRG